MRSNKLLNVFAGASVAAALIFGCVQWVRATPPAGQSSDVRLVPGEEREKQVFFCDPFEKERQRCEEVAAQMEAEGIFVYDCAAGELLYCSTEPDQALYPASVTKLFTAWVALQYLSAEDVITVGDELELVLPGSSTAFLSKGNRLKAAMLVEAMLLPSGNDAAYVLAAAAGRVIAGDLRLSGAKAVTVFVEEMNRQAAHLGARHTGFSNPDGYHRENHVSTPEDLALLGSVALEEPMIAAYSSLPADAVCFVSGETITWYNTNRLVSPEDAYYTPSIAGGKTGYTSQAGYCLLARFDREDRKLMIGVFGTKNRADRYLYARELLSALGFQS